MNIHRNPAIPPFPRTTVIPAANTRVFRTSRKSLTFTGLRFFMSENPPYGFAEEPFPHCGTGFSTPRKSICRMTEKAFRQRGTGFFIRRQLTQRDLNITKTAHENSRSAPPERPSRDSLSILRIYSVNIFYHKNAYLCIPIVHVPVYIPAVCPCQKLQYAHQATVCRDSVPYLIMRGNL